MTPAGRFDRVEVGFLVRARYQAALQLKPQQSDVALR
jgi:hypothetical protein